MIVPSNECSLYSLYSIALMLLLLLLYTLLYSSSKCFMLHQLLKLHFLVKYSTIVSLTYKCCRYRVFLLDISFLALTLNTEYTLTFHLSSPASHLKVVYDNKPNLNCFHSQVVWNCFWLKRVQTKQRYPILFIFNVFHVIYRYYNTCYTYIGTNRSYRFLTNNLK